MNSRFRFVLSIGFFLTGAGFFFFSFWLQRDHAAATTSITKLDLAIHSANRIELLLLAPTQTDPSQKTFKTAGYGDLYFVTDTRSLSPDSIAELKQILSDHYFTTGSSSPCHSPGQVLRFYKNSSLLLEASLCLECTNFHFFVYPFAPAAVTLGEKTVEYFDLRKLAAFLERVKKG